MQFPDGVLYQTAFRSHLFITDHLLYIISWRPWRLGGLNVFLFFLCVSVVSLHFDLAEDWRLKTEDCFGNLGVGHSTTPIAANPADPAAEMTQNDPIGTSNLPKLMPILPKQKGVLSHPFCISTGSPLSIFSPLYEVERGRG